MSFGYTKGVNGNIGKLMKKISKMFNRRKLGRKNE
jgi:hypothetical protein